MRFQISSAVSLPNVGLNVTKTKRDLLFLVIGLVSMAIIVFAIGLYVRSNGPNILLATLVAALPAGFVIVVTSFALRKANLTIQIIWCIALLIMIRSVALWKPGIDFHDELYFIGSTTNLFQHNISSGYLQLFPVNIFFAGIFYGIYTFFWRNLESFEFLQFFVYPLLVIGYYFMVNEVAKLKTNLFFSKPYAPAIMFLAFAPVFTLIPTYYWPQLLGTAVLFFTLGSLLHVLSAQQKSIKWIAITILLSIFLTFVHNITCFLYIGTIFFFFLALHDRVQRHILLIIGTITFVSFMAAHLDQYSPLIKRVLLTILGNSSAASELYSFRFTSLNSVMMRNPIVTLANTGFYLIIFFLVLVSLSKITNDSKTPGCEGKQHLYYSKRLISKIFNDPITLSFFGFSIIAIVSGIALAGLFDPVRLLGWISLLMLPRLVPSERLRLLFFMIALLAFFFLLVWIVNSPWGSPFYSNPNLNSKGY